VRAAVSEELSPGRPTWITGDFRTSGLLGLIRTSSSFRFFCAIVAVATNLSAYVTVLAALLCVLVLLAIFSDSPSLGL